MNAQRKRRRARRPRASKAAETQRSAPGLRRALWAAAGVFASGALLLGALILWAGPERVREKAVAWVPGWGEVVTIPEGFTLWRVADRLEAAQICTAKEFLAAAQAPAVLSELGISGASAEGFIYPATYVFEREEAPTRVLSRLVRERRARLAALTAAREQAGLSELELLTLASIVERETALPEERPRIARVFLNRLADVGGPTRGRLQSDPTAAYGCLVLGPDLASCRDFHGQVSPEMLKDAANPYNTYRFAGLPPGPIATPGEASIQAVLGPAAGDELFFVADGTGRHTFTRSFEEHRQAVEQLKVREK